MLPLYKLNNICWKELIRNADTAHAGLLFDKFPDGWNPDENYQPKHKDRNGKLIDDKKTFFDFICTKYKPITETHLKNNLDSALIRQRDLVNHLQGKSLIVTTDWRFISGLGTAHPYETGFIWHRTLSVPYLPGSSVKGLIRAWAEQWGGLSDQEEVTRLFGTEKEEAHCGALIIFDALPSQPPKLEIDILNPHYSEYYQNPAKPPADYLSPIPVFFLTVAPGYDFEFFLAARKDPKSEQAKQDLATGLRLLQEALETLGAGGKTAVGYGVFKESKTAQQKREAEQNAKQQRQEIEAHNAALNAIVQAKAYTGLAEQIYRQARQENWETSNNATQFYQAMPDYFQKIAEEPDMEIKQAAIAIISEIVEKKFPGILQDPERKEGRKDKPAYKEKPKEIANKLLGLIAL